MNYQRETPSDWTNSLSIRFTRNRWLNLKGHEIEVDLTYILLFTQEPAGLGRENPRLCSQVDDILSKLRGGQKDELYIKIVRIATKYLKGIRKFLSTTYRQGISFYKHLFESTMIAIVREVGSLEQNTLLVL